MVTELMQADLNTIIRTQQLSDDHVQCFVYQIARALKVCPVWTVVVYLLLSNYYLSRHKVRLAGNVLMLVTMNGARYHSGARCLSVCTSVCKFLVLLIMTF